MLTPRLTHSAREVGGLIAGLRLKLALAESCTAGLAAAALGGIPGGSCWLCGSAVVYRTETKMAWLGVDPPHLVPPEPDSVGAGTSRALAEALLRTTPEADLAATITGHLGPDAPAELDGRIFVQVLQRADQVAFAEPVNFADALRLEAQPTGDPLEFRLLRQMEAAAVLLEAIAEQLRRLANRAASAAPQNATSLA
ncbi:MAG: CinA family protein [Planctomyces sp.]|nr:CinA family protein [Planctomyces sp.]